MSAIAGCVGAQGWPAAESCSVLMQAMALLGPDGQTTEVLGNASFGTLHFHTLPEDDFDRQPYVGCGGRLLLAADARVDNREEIAAGLNLPASELRLLSDAELLLRGWERWGLNLCDRLLGDIALAVWDARSEELALVRTPLSNRALFYHRATSFVAFASLPSALAQIPPIGQQANIDTMASQLAGGIFCPGEMTMFHGIECLPPAHAVLLRREGKRLVKLWSLDAATTDVSVAEAGEAMAAELDRAVMAQMRRRNGKIACQLSAGRDSSAVAASAASLEEGVIAITAAPRPDFPPVEECHLLADESVLAGQTARQAGLRHIVCRSQTAELVSQLEGLGRSQSHPIENPINLPWLVQTYSEAKVLGSTVLLTGSSGNFGFSLGGFGFLGDYWRDRGPLAWWGLAKEFRAEGESWRRLLSVSFAHFVPLPAYNSLRRLSGRGDGSSGLPLLKGRTKTRAEEIRRERLGDVRAPASRRLSHGDMLMRLETSDKYPLAEWGVDVRDPTADRRLVELCYSLPVEAFISANVARPAYAAAFGARLPAAVVAGRQVGYQAADWFETIRPEEIRTAFRSYMRHPLVEEMFDLAAIEALLDAWPRQKGDSDEIYESYCNQLLGSLAMASFINCHFPA